jgi:hypothetical protein
MPADVDKRDNQVVETTAAPGATRSVTPPYDAAMPVWKRPFVVGLLVMLAGCASAESASPQPTAALDRPAVAPSGSPEAEGQSRPLAPAELQGRWWTWATSAAGRSNPVEDLDGHACGVGQPADVWFLAGTFGGYANRTCSVPSSRPLAFPLVNQSSAQAQCRDFMSTATGKAILDGRELTPQRLEGIPIVVDSVEDNPVTSAAGRSTSYGCGLWVQLRALSPGTHVLRIEGASGDFALRVDYTLHVSDTPAAGDAPSGGDASAGGGTSAPRAA